jgi:uncharacterized protein (DUF2267 family)
VWRYGAGDRSAAVRIEGQLPGTPAEGPEPRLEWVSAEDGIVGELRARLGSEARPEVLLVAVLSSLRGWLERDTFEGVAEELPWELRGILRAPEQLPTVPRLAGKDGFIAAVSERAQRTPAEAVHYARAVFATLRKHLARGLADAVERELPPDVAELWRTAR